MSNKKDTTIKGQIHVKDLSVSTVNTMKGYEIRYNDKWLQTIGPDNIREWDKYIPMGEEVQRIEERINKATYPLCIEGDKGIGKTLLSYYLAKKNKFAFMPIQCSEQVKERQLFGSPQINEGGSFYWAGRITTAFKALELYDKVLIFFDDVGGLAHEEQMSLLSLCDKRKTIEVNGEIMSVPKGKKLMVLMTTNPATYAGVNTIIEPLRSRLIGEIWEYPKVDTLKKIIDWKDIPEDTVQEPLLTLASQTHDLRMKNNVDYVLTTRDLVEFADVYRDCIEGGKTQKMSLDQSIRQTILFKYTDPTERESIRVRCQEGFGVDVK